VTLPGPPGALWALALILWALVAAVTGEAVRVVASRWVPQWRSADPLERGILDVYLGGAFLYLVAALPIGAFTDPVVFGIPILAAGALVLLVARLRRAGNRPAIEATFARLGRPWVLVAIASALGLYLVELAVALPVPTGNTYDASLLTSYTALLLQHHTLPLSFSPYSASMIVYPQGITAWLGWAQISFGLPPARTSLLVTPLFFALAPLSGFVFGRRMFGTERAGAVVAIVLAWLGPGTRTLVAGSNDLVVAFPLVLLLAAQSTVWLRGTPGRGDAIGFGVLLGYSAAINPVGAEWMLPALVVIGLVGRPAFGGATARWLGRWALTLAVSLVAIVPSLYVLVLGRTSPILVPGAAGPPPGSTVGITGATWVGSVDPFLFRGGDVQLSPLASIRIELALLLVLGLLILVAVGRTSALGRYLGPFRRWALAAGVTIAAWLGLLVDAGSDGSPVRVLAYLTSAQELTLWLFSVYALVAAIPLILVVERLAASAPRTAAATPPERTPGTPRTRAQTRALASTAVLLTVAILLVVPGIVLTPTSLAPGLGRIYRDFGNVSAGDFALLQAAASDLPAGSRVLVAPGSAAEFLPGYAPDIVLLYPMEPGWAWVNASYTDVVSELTNGTLNALGNASLTALSVEYIAVTMQNTILWPAFSPAPMLADSAKFHQDFHDADAYLFAVT